MTGSFRSSCVRASLAVTSAIYLVALVPAAAQAQGAPAPQQAEEAPEQAIIITGSRIARRDYTDRDAVQRHAQPYV